MTIRGSAPGNAWRAIYWLAPVLLLAGLAVLLFPVRRTNGRLRPPGCMDHLADIRRGLAMYVDDWGAAPPRPRPVAGQSLLRAYLDERYLSAVSWQCPAAAGPVSYGCNPLALWDAAGRPFGEQAAGWTAPVPLFADADTPLVGTGPATPLSGPPAFRHRGRALVAWLDGRVTRVAPAELDRLRWAPAEP